MSKKRSSTRVIHTPPHIGNVPRTLRTNGIKKAIKAILFGVDSTSTNNGRKSTTMFTPDLLLPEPNFRTVSCGGEGRGPGSFRIRVRGVDTRSNSRKTIRTYQANRCNTPSAAELSGARVRTRIARVRVRTRIYRVCLIFSKNKINSRTRRVFCARTTARGGHTYIVTAGRATCARQRRRRRIYRYHGWETVSGALAVRWGNGENSRP